MKHPNILICKQIITAKQNNVIKYVSNINNIITQLIVRYTYMIVIIYYIYYTYIFH